MLRSSYERLRRVLETDVVAAAREMLGWDIVRGRLRARIVEVEAYHQDEPACHAFGKTKMKNMALFARPGMSYVYFAYGNHWMLNVVARPVGEASAVLIRAARPLGGLEDMRQRRPKAVRDEDLLSGPGKICAAFGIGSAQNMIDLLESVSDLHLEPGEAAHNVLTAPRVGIAVGKAHDYLWRYIDGDALSWASRPRPSARSHHVVPRGIEP